MYNAWRPGGTSPWCVAFSVENLQVLEYLEDLEMFYKVAYGNELNLKLGEFAIRDMLSKIL